MVVMSVVMMRLVPSMMSPGSERRSGNHQEKQGCRKNRLHAIESSMKRIGRKVPAGPASHMTNPPMLPQTPDSVN